MSPHLITLIGVTGLVLLLMLLLRGRKEALEQVKREIAGLVEGDLVIAPQRGSFRGSTSKYGVIKCDGIIYLTYNELVFHPDLGNNIVRIDTSEIKEITENTWFLGAYRGGRRVLILNLPDQVQVGFMVIDNEQWKTKLEAITDKNICSANLSVSTNNDHT